MNNLHNDFDEELKKMLFDYSEEPDTRLWERIAPVASWKENRTSWWPRALSVLLIVSFLMGVYVFRDKIKGGKSSSAIGNATNKVLDEESKNESELRDEKLNGISTSEIQQNRNEFSTLVQSINTEKESIDPYSNLSARVNELRPLLNGELSLMQSEIENEYVDSGSGPVTITVSTDSARVDNGEEFQMVIKTPISAATEAELKRRDEEKRYRRFTLYFTAMPTFGYQRIESNSSDNLLIESVKRIPAFSMNRLGLRAEFGAELPLNSRCKLFGGLLYFHRKQTIGYTEKSIDTTYIYEDPFGDIRIETEFDYEDKTFDYELRNVGAQLGVNFILRKRKFLQTLGTGLEFQTALNRKRPKTDENFTSDPSAYVFYNFYYRIQYPAEGRLKAVFQPTFNYSFYINQDVHAPFYVKPYGLGLNIGCTYNF